MNITKTKRLTKDTGYIRPKKTLQDTMSKEEIKEKLQGYKKVTDITNIVIGTHLRYFTRGKDKKEVFRLGGFLTKFGEDYKYVVLSNGQLSWSVQLNGTNEFWAKMNPKEFKEKIETEAEERAEEKYKEVIEKTEDAEKYKDKYKQLKNQTDYVLNMLKEQQKENDKLKKKLKAIEDAAKKDKEKR